MSAEMIIVLVWLGGSIGIVAFGLGRLYECWEWERALRAAPIDVAYQVVRHLNPVRPRP